MATKAVKAQAAAMKVAPKRIRRTREEGKRLLLEAAQQLLETGSPDDIGIRDVGALAGVHHRFIMEWFGGKVALFRAVHDARAHTMSNLIASTREIHDKKLGRTLDSIRHEMVLVNWLIVNGSHFENLDDAYPALVGVKKFLRETYNLSEEAAEKSAQVIGSIVVAEAMLRPHMEITYSAIDIIIHHIEAMASMEKK